MNISSKLLEYRSPCCGRYSLRDPWTFAAGGLGLIGSLIGGNQQRKSVAANNRANLQIARETNQAQKDIADANNQMQIAMMRENNQWSADQAVKMFNLENDYNSPGAQAQRLLAAGFSPSVALGNGAMSVSTGNVSTPSSAGSSISPAMPNFVTPTMQAPPSVLLGAVDSIAQLASAASSFAQSRKTSREAARVDEQIDAEVKSLLAQAKNADASAAYQDTMNKINSDWLPKKFEGEIASLFSQTYLNYLKGDTEQAEASFKRFQAKLSELEGKRYDAETPLVLKQAQEAITLLQEKQKTERSMQSSNYASASHNRAMARLTNEQASQLEDLHDTNVRTANILAGKEALDFKYLDAVSEYRVNLLRYDSDISAKKLDVLEQELKKAKKENNLYYWRFFFERLDKTAQDVGYVAPWKIGVNDASTQSSPYWQTGTR